MRALLLITALCLLTPTVAAGPPSIGDVVQDTWEEHEHCFLILARPYETPQEAAFGMVAVATCLAE